MVAEIKEIYELDGRYIYAEEWHIMTGRWKAEKRIPDFWDGTWVTGPSGNDIRLESPHMRDDDTEQEWSIFRLLFKQIAKDMESQGWQL